MTVNIHSSFAVHPGRWLRTEFIEPYGFNVTEAAAKLGVTRQAMSNLLAGKAGLSAEMAIRFEKAFDVSAATLLRMQVAHDLALARSSQDKIKVERVAAAA